MYQVNFILTQPKSRSAPPLPPPHLPDHPPLGDGWGIPYTNTVWYHIIRNLLVIMTHYRILALVVSLELFHPLADLSEPIQLPFLTTHKAKTRRFGKFPQSESRYTAKKREETLLHILKLNKNYQACYVTNLKHQVTEISWVK